MRATSAFFGVNMVSKRTGGFLTGKGWIKGGCCYGNDSDHAPLEPQGKNLPPTVVFTSV